MHRRAWRATVHGVTKAQTQLSDCHSCECLFPSSLSSSLHMSSMSVSLFLLNIKAHLYHFFRFHMGTTLYNVGFTLSELLYSFDSL